MSVNEYILLLGRHDVTVDCGPSNGGFPFDYRQYPFLRSVMDIEWGVNAGVS